MKKDVKQLIMRSAILLFNNKGFSGTSIRDIAKQANVNIANISYYFKSKHGLLEHCLTAYFEQYINKIEQCLLVSTVNNNCPKETLKLITESILTFQSEQSQLTRFVLREVSIDSQIIREVMTTYYKKEWFYLKNVFKHCVPHKNNHADTVNYLIIQFKGLLAMPYLNIQYASEVLCLQPHEQYFAKKYYQEVELWINSIFEKDAIVAS